MIGYRTRSLVFLVLLLGLAYGPVEAQESHYFALSGPGTASVMISKERATAYITDGGLGGRRGLQGATLEGKKLVDALQEKKVRHLVITCSHPHSDHMGGLVDLLRKPAELARRFESLTLIDSGYGEGSLKDIYDAAARASQQANPGLELLEAEHSSAAGRNAFAGLSMPKDDVFVRNFEYKPRPRSSIHGHSIVTMYTLRDGNSATSVVDFDDANSRVVGQWADSGHRADVLIIPHHGSDAEKIDKLLTVGARACVVSVDPANRYRHPGPQNLLKLIRHFGKENVYLTGSMRNVYIDASGAGRHGGDHQQAFEDHVRPQQRHLERRIRTLEERLVLQKSEVESSTSEAPPKTLLAKARRTKKSLGEARASFLATLEIERLMTGAEPRQRWWDPDTPSDFLTARRGRPEISPSADTLRAAEPATLPSLPRHTGIWHSKVEPEIARRFDGKMWTPQAEFQANFIGLPTVGGVIIGNTVDPRGLELHSAEWVECETAEECDDLPARLRLETSRGILWYEEMTASEAVLAHRFVDAKQVALVSGSFDDDGEHVFGVNPILQNTLVAYDAMRLDSFFEAADSTLKLSDEVIFRMPSWSMLVWYDRPSYLSVGGDRLGIATESEPIEALMSVRFADIEYPAWFSRSDPDSASRELRRRIRSDPQWRAVHQRIDSEKEPLDERIAELRTRLEKARDGYERSKRDRIILNDQSQEISGDGTQELMERIWQSTRQPPIESPYPSVGSGSLLGDRAALDIMFYEELQKQHKKAVERFNEQVPVWNRLSREVTKELEERYRKEILDEIESRRKDPANVLEREESEIFNRNIGLVQAQSASYRRLNAFARTVQILNWVRASLGTLPELPPSIRLTRLNVPHDSQPDQLLSPQIKALRNGESVSSAETGGPTTPSQSSDSEDGSLRKQESSVLVTWWPALVAFLALGAVVLFGRRSR